MATTLISPTAYALLLLLLLLFTASCEAENILYTGDTLNTGQALGYGSYVFRMQTDCNLVLYDSGRAVWASNTRGKGTNCRLVMQRDGNLVIYNNGQAVWASNTQRKSGNYVCILQRDRNVVIYGGSIWATNTRDQALASEKIGSSVVVTNGTSVKVRGNEKPNNKN